MWDDVFGCGAVTFPKSVRIENKRLAIMYYSLAAGALTFVIRTIITERSYLRIATPTGRVFFWVSKPTWDVGNEEAKKVNAAFGSLDICKDPERFAYCDAPGCRTAWKDMKCMDLCTDDVVNDCTEMSERWFKEDYGIFFPTYFNETVTMFESGSKTSTNRQRILKGLEEMVLAFDHEYNVEDQKETGTNKDPDGNLLTVLLDKDDNEIDRWEPGKAVTVSLKQMLDGAGLSMDSVMDNYGPNFLEGAKFSNGILARLAGIGIDVELHYTNSALAFTDDWDGPVCYVRMNAAVAWNSKPMVDAFDPAGSHRLRYYQGLRIRFKSGGAFGELNLGQVLSGLTSCLVFVGAAKKLTQVFAMTCLGVLSRIYKRFIRQNVSLERDACGLAARLTAHTSSFMELKDSVHGVSKIRLERRLVRIFRNVHALNMVEIQRFSDWLYSKMNVEGEAAINVEEYAAACAFGELVSIADLIQIFDADRKKGFLEGLFVDPSVRAIMKSDKHLRGAKGNQLAEQIKNERKQSGAMKKANTLQALDTVSEQGSSSTTKAIGQTESPSNPTVSPDQLTVSPELLEVHPSDLEAADHDAEAAEEEGDLLEVIQKTEAALKRHTLRLEDEHAKLKDMVHGHISDYTNSISEVQISIGNVNNRLSELEVFGGEDAESKDKKVQQEAISARGEQMRNDLGALSQQMEALKQRETDYMSKLDSFTPLGLEVERLKQLSEQLESDFAKLSTRMNSSRFNGTPRAPQGSMVVEEKTYRRVVGGDPASLGHISPGSLGGDRQAVAHQALNPHTQGALNGSSKVVQRDEGPCGLPPGWDLCGDRTKEKVQKIER